MKKTNQKDWHSKVKNRLHFDNKCSKSKAQNIVNKENIAKHKFFPFIHFEIKQFKLSKKLAQKENEQSIIDPYKVRNIYYAGHSDSYIFSYYNEKILKFYEKFLQDNSLNCSIAYRHIDKNKKGEGKSNIDFAAEAFYEIKKRKECYAVGLDIKSFFDELNHTKLYNNLCKFIKNEKLPEDLYKIFKILTNFHYIELNELLKNKHINAKKSDFFNKETHSFKKICTAKILRQIISQNKKIIKDNPNITKGIPQGTNLSGTLANIYMLDFDIIVQKFINNVNGYYRRYSDDILILVNTKEDLEKILFLVEDELKKLDLKISKEKTICCYFNDDVCEYIPCCFKEKYIKNAKFQYLGFTYDGKNILLRDETLGAFWRDALRHIRSMVLDNYRRKKRIPIAKIYGLYTHLKNKESKYGNFYSYVRKAQKIFEEDYEFGTKVKIPLTIPKPALKIGTTPILLPAIKSACILQIGVSISFFSRGKSLVTSYAISNEISSASSLKSFVVVSTILIIETLC